MSTTTTKRPAKKRPAKKRTSTHGRAHTNGQAGTNGKAAAAKGAVGEPPAHVSMPDCRVDQIEPHPKNPRLAFSFAVAPATSKKQMGAAEARGSEPPQNAMVELKESLKRHGMLEPVLVREVGAAKYQLLGGERRWRAAKALKWATIPARVIDVDDVAALEILGAENLDRSDLTDIEIAGYIATLCTAVDEGGGGKTRAEAAAIFGKSESWAHNLVRLLELPKKWQERVASGELDQTKARALIPYVHVPAIMKAFDKDYMCDEWNALHPNLVRDEWNDIVEQIADTHTRSMDRKIKHWHGGMDVDWQSFPCLIDVDAPGGREKLGIVKLKKPDGSGKLVDVELATNVKLWEELQLAAAKAKHLAKGKAKGQAGSDGKARKPTAAELKRKNEQRARQHRERIARWRKEWMRVILAGVVNPGDWQVLKVLMYGALNHHSHAMVSRAFDLTVQINGGRVVSGGYSRDSLKSLTTILSREKGAAAQLGIKADALASAMVAEMLWPEKPVKNNQPVELPDDLIEQLAIDYDLDLAAEWKDAWNDESQGSRIRAFFELHSKDQLADLAKELKIKTDGAKTKGDVVDFFVTAKTPKLPKAIKPVKQAK